MKTNAVCAIQYTRCSVQDTVLISGSVFGRSGHVEQDQFGFLGFFDNDFIQSECGVHASDVELVSDDRNMKS